MLTGRLGTGSLAKFGLEGAAAAAAPVGAWTGSAGLGGPSGSVRLDPRPLRKEGIKKSRNDEAGFFFGGGGGTLTLGCGAVPCPPA